jgi:membrane fusion protein, multidrug efflux system
MNSKIFYLILPALALFLLSSEGCAKKKEASREMPPRPVTSAKVEKKSVPFYLEEIGNCIAVESVTISAQVSGKITDIHFMDGADLKKDDKLFTIDPRPYQAELDSAEAALKKDKATFEYNKSKLDRSKDLVPGNYISPDDFDTLKTSVATAEAQVKADEAAIATAKINLEYCYINSPIEGRASVRLVDAGNVVSGSGTGTALLSIQRMDPMYVDFIVAENDLPKVRSFLGSGKLNAQVYFADDEKKARTAELFFVDNTVQAATGTVKLRAILPNKDRMFWPGQFVRVRIILQELSGALVVPYSAVQISQKGPYLFVIKADKTAEMRPVLPGQRQGEDVVITRGVSEGEEVVATGQLGIGPGSKVAVVPAGAEAQANPAAAASKPDEKKEESK